MAEIDEGLLLTPEGIAKILNDYFPYIGKKDMRNEAIHKILQLAEAQLAKATPIIEARKDAVFKAKLVPPRVLEETIQVRVGEAVKQERERIIKYVEDNFSEYVTDTPEWQALKKQNKRLLTLEEAREIRKHQTFLDPYWSADRENAMILAGAEAQDAKMLKEVGKWLEKHRASDVKEIINEVGHRDRWLEPTNYAVVYNSDIEALKRGEMPE